MSHVDRNTKIFTLYYHGMKVAVYCEDSAESALERFSIIHPNFNLYEVKVEEEPLVIEGKVIDTGDWNVCRPE